MTTTQTLTDLLALIEPPEYYEAKPHKAGRDLESVRAAILRQLAGRAPEPPHFHIWSEIPCRPGECRMPPPTDDEREALTAVLDRTWQAPMAERIRAIMEWRNRHRGPITDEVVEAAMRAHDYSLDRGTTRAVLEAAEAARATR